MNRPSITAVIITKNEADMIGNCINCLGWCDAILVVDNGSTDSTAEIADKLGAHVISFKHSSFARVRNEAVKSVSTAWILYVDADERVSPELAKEIQVNLETSDANAYTFLRQNIFFGRHFKHGGWENDRVTRCFRKESFKEWTGSIHETAHFEGTNKLLTFPLIHFSHRDTASGLIKSAAWTPMEAELLHKAGEPPVTFFTVLRKGLGEFYRRAFVKQGKRDGEAGMFEALIQGINRMLVYIQVWELQQKPTLPQLYALLEKDIQDKWRKS